MQLVITKTTKSLNHSSSSWTTPTTGARPTSERPTSRLDTSTKSSYRKSSTSTPTSTITADRRIRALGRIRGIGIMVIFINVRISLSKSRLSLLTVGLQGTYGMEVKNLGIIGTYSPVDSSLNSACKGTRIFEPSTTGRVAIGARDILNRERPSITIRRMVLRGGLRSGFGDEF